MIFDFSILPAFLLASAVVILTPGMDVFLLLRTSVRAGTKAGVLALAGVQTASAVQLGAVVLGLGVTLASFPPALTVLRWLGAAYLAFLALTIVRDLVRQPARQQGEPTDRPVVKHPFRQGFLSSIANPKMLLFSLAFLPQFIGSGDKVAQLGLLAACFMVMALCWEGMIVLAAARVSGKLKRPAVSNTLDAVSAAAFLSISIGLVLS
ncbi:LysE family translocator [Kutzneria viridogrisea]|uniref:Uncharacterized protein n=2 Tax=Kutzneria TaxID=43356 RepID=W5WHC7_9PSEU|nr:LysE family translocator [Kutzneria albida]AHI00604.1 hypothetical protein KALB_7246 [Kutzneria albida DSM 43870]MBA8925784.1 threonine/homoserine/homoserine lactone efflux protein [Kutzneria viridogrisea]